MRRTDEMLAKQHEHDIGLKDVKEKIKRSASGLQTSRMV